MTCSFRTAPGTISCPTFSIWGQSFQRGCKPTLRNEHEPFRSFCSLSWIQLTFRETIRPPTGCGCLKLQELSSSGGLFHIRNLTKLNCPAKRILPQTSCFLHDDNRRPRRLMSPIPDLQSSSSQFLSRAWGPDVVPPTKYLRKASSKDP
jgi:hypothetical protein